MAVGEHHVKGVAQQGQLEARFCPPVHSDHHLTDQCLPAAASTLTAQPAPMPCCMFACVAAADAHGQPPCWAAFELHTLLIDTPDAQLPPESVTMIQPPADHKLGKAHLVRPLGASCGLLVWLLLVAMLCSVLRHRCCWW